MSDLHQSTSGFNVIFIHSSLDECALTTGEFRVYAHLSRRASNGQAFPGFDSMASICRMNRKTVMESVEELERRKMIRVVKSPGKSNRYYLTPPAEWITDQSVSGNATPVTSPNEGTHPSVLGNAPVRSRYSKVIQEGNPTKVIQEPPLQVLPGTSVPTVPTKRKTRGGAKKAEDLPPIPEDLKTSAVEVAWDQWVADRAERRKPLTTRAAELCFKDLRDWGAEKWCQAIEKAIRRGWQGLFEPGSGVTRQASAEPEWKIEKRLKEEIEKLEADTYYEHDAKPEDLQRLAAARKELRTLRQSGQLTTA